MCNLQLRLSLLIANRGAPPIASTTTLFCIVIFLSCVFVFLPYLCPFLNLFVHISHFFIFLYFSIFGYIICISVEQKSFPSAGSIAHPFSNQNIADSTDTKQYTLKYNLNTLCYKYCAELNCENSVQFLFLFLGCISQLYFSTVFLNCFSHCISQPYSTTVFLNCVAQSLIAKNSV